MIPPGVPRRPRIGTASSSSFSRSCPLLRGAVHSVSTVKRCCRPTPRHVCARAAQPLENASKLVEASLSTDVSDGDILSSPDIRDQLQEQDSPFCGDNNRGGGYSSCPPIACQLVKFCWQIASNAGHSRAPPRCSQVGCLPVIDGNVSRIPMDTVSTS